MNDLNHRQTIIDRLKARDRADIFEPWHALKVESDPQILPRVVQMVDAHDGKGYLPQIANIVTPASKIDDYVVDLTVRFGGVKDLGETKPLKHYTIGRQRIDGEREEEMGVFLQNVLQKDNLKNVATYFLASRDNFTLLEDTAETQADREKLWELQSFSQKSLNFMIRAGISMVPNKMMARVAAVAEHKMMKSYRETNAELTMENYDQSEKFKQKMLEFYQFPQEDEQSELVKLDRQSRILYGMMQVIDFK